MILKKKIFELKFRFIFQAEQKLAENDNEKIA